MSFMNNVQSILVQKRCEILE